MTEPVPSGFEDDAGTLWYPDPVFDPDAVLLRDASEDAAARQRLDLALSTFTARRASGTVHATGATRADALGWHVPQQNRYACGPATAETLIRSQGVSELDGVTVSQDVLAADENLEMLRHGGTRWIFNVMARTLTRWIPAEPYLATEAPTADQLRAIVTWSGERGRLVASEVRQRPGGRHLPGHPTDRELFHWFVIAAWDPTTDEVLVIDPASTPWVGWGGDVDAVYRVRVDDVVAMSADHGVVW